MSSLTEMLRPFLRVARASIAKAGARRKRSVAAARGGCRVPLSPIRAGGWSDQPQTPACAPPVSITYERGPERGAEIGRASCRERVCQSKKISEVDAKCKKQKIHTTT